MKKLKKIPILIILFVTLLQFSAMGQDDPFDPADSPPDPSDVPIDGGLAFLLAAGAAYGVKKYREVTGKEEEVSAMAV
jgi:hypothetical protein